MSNISKISAFFLLCGAALAVSAVPEVLWSDPFSIDTDLAQTVDLKSDDPMFLSSAWLGGSGDEAEITAVGATSGKSYQVAVLYHDDYTTSNAWDYFVDNADLRENYLITFTTKTGEETVFTKTATVRLVSSLQDEAGWSGNFSLDTAGTAPNVTLTLRETDGIAYDARWAEGEDRVIKVSAVSQEVTPESYDLCESEVEGYGTFTWAYKSMDVPSGTDYTLCYEITNEAGTETYALDSAQPAIRILPEPLAFSAFLALAVLFAARKKGGRG